VPPARCLLEVECGFEHLDFAGAGFVRVAFGDEVLVFDDAVVVEADGDEDDIAVMFWVVVFEHVVEEPEFWGPHFSVVGESSFEEYRLGDPFFGGHVYVSLEDLAVEGVVRVSADEECAHGFDECVEGPHLCPFSDGVGDGRLFVDEVGDEDVVHVGAVVHGEDDGGFGVDVLDEFFVEEFHADAVQES